MPFFVRALPMAIATLVVACEAAEVDDAATVAAANLGEGEAIPEGPLKPDLTFGEGGTLVLEGSSSALALGRFADGALAVLRNRATSEVVLTLVKADGSASSDVVLPDVESLTRAEVFAQGDGVVVVGGGDHYYAARVGANGTLDPTFMPDPLDLAVQDAALDASGRILVSGALAGNKAAVVRLTANGGIDTTFADGQGAWIDAAEAPSAASFLAIADDGAIAFATTAGGTPSLHRLDERGALDRSFGKGGAVALPAGEPAGLVAGSGGALAYFGPAADSRDVHAFSIAKRGAVTPGAKIDGVLLDAATQLSALTTDDVCTLHVASATTELTGAECAAGVRYVALGEGRRAIAITTPGESGSAVRVRVFAP